LELCFFSKAQIEQAKDDWGNGHFPVIPGDEKESIPFKTKLKITK